MTVKWVRRKTRVMSDENAMLTHEPDLLLIEREHAAGHFASARRMLRKAIAKMEQEKGAEQSASLDALRQWEKRFHADWLGWVFFVGGLLLLALVASR